MILGAHESIAGGLYRACERAEQDGCRALQVFTRNSSQWAVRPLAAGEVREFRRAVRAAGLGPLMAHDSYLINLASLDRTLRERSIETFYVELARCEELGIDYLVTHPGAHLGDGEEAGLARVEAALETVFRRTAGYRCQVLLETTAGQGTTLGWRFEHLGRLLHGLARAGLDGRAGICLDTCHVFSAGYALHDGERGYESTLAELDRVAGLGRVRAFHLNDSKCPFGARVDRHAEIGLGHIGEGLFSRLVRDPRFAERPAVLETPPGPDRKPSFRRNLLRLRQLEAGARPRQRFTRRAVRARG